MAIDNLQFTPGVKIKEVQLGSPPIVGVGTSTAGFVGKAPKANSFPNVARLVTSLDQFVADYVKDLANSANDATDSTDLSLAVTGFYQNGGTTCWIVNVDSIKPVDVVAGVKLLELVDDVQIIAAPGSTDASVYGELEDQCVRKGDRFAILDSPAKVGALPEIMAGGAKRPKDCVYAAFYYPRIRVPPQLKNDSTDPAKPIWVAPSGHLAGVYARTDGTRGVHKAPANTPVMGALAVEHVLSDAEQNSLNQDGVDVIRAFVEGPTVWGARTVTSNAGDPFLYVNVRRLTNYVERSLQRGLRFAVFEPNNLPLRQTITRSVRGFLDGVWRDGALFGATADEAYYVRFPEAFNTDAERAAGKLTIEIGIRVSYPAEFVIIRIGLLSQSASSS